MASPSPSPPAQTPADSGQVLTQGSVLPGVWPCVLSIKGTSPRGQALLLVPLPIPGERGTGKMCVCRWGPHCCRESLPFASDLRPAGTLPSVPGGKGGGEGTRQVWSCLESKHPHLGKYSCSQALGPHPIPPADRQGGRPHWGPHAFLRDRRPNPTAQAQGRRTLRCTEKCHPDRDTGGPNSGRHEATEWDQRVNIGH